MLSLVASRSGALTAAAPSLAACINTNGYVQPPAGAPEAVKQMIAAGNAIATLPYIWGGGHGSFQADTDSSAVHRSTSSASARQLA